ncbi:TetR/AcrR family transcriptional regulator [Halopseudomonas xiamenensis]|uniref:TetR/AcrR family transcriptional regulator n=1 Tax=Halopseudomonas xiamenensis TaxID=157792 RepID=UPI001629B0C2|nr:TetR/AcrR family transcriptional regulator [Halopseudomonas xiamenensis]
MAAKPNTRERILQASLQLFNTQGERNVTTNHIASHLGISPGNLYYHFRNKSMIVAELFTEFERRMEVFFTLPEGATVTLEDKTLYLERLLEIIWQFRFLHQGLEYLLESDPELAVRYRQFSQRSLCNTQKIYQAFADAGILQLDTRQVETLSINVWIVLSAWTQFLTTTQGTQLNLSQQQLRRGIYQILVLEEGYLAPAYQEAVRALCDQLYVPLEDIRPC